MNSAHNPTDIGPQPIRSPTPTIATAAQSGRSEHLVEAQVSAIKSLKIDKITVWDGAGGAAGSSTANFAASLIKSLPPLHEVARMAGVELPEYLGQATERSSEPR